MAEREGFEPPVPFRVRRFSRPEPSTTRPPLRISKQRLINITKGIFLTFSNIDKTRLTLFLRCLKGAAMRQHQRPRRHQRGSIQKKSRALLRCLSYHRGWRAQAGLALPLRVQPQHWARLGMAVREL